MSQAQSGNVGPRRPLAVDPAVVPITWAAYFGQAASRVGTQSIVWIVTGLLVAILALQTYWYENDFIYWKADWRSIPLVPTFAMLVASLLALLTRRIYASIAAACGLLIILTIISVYKFEHLRATLHALDFYFYARPTEVVFLAEYFPKIVLAALAAAAMAGALVWFLFAADETRVSRRRAALALGFAGLALAGAYAWRGQRDKIYHFVGRYHVSSIIASIPEALGVLMQGGLLEAADKGGKIDSTPLPMIHKASSGERAPTIISILHESSFPTDMFPIQCGGPKPAALYTSSNGRRYDLRVETYGGATWLTEYGLLLGISTYSFGDARSFIGYTMEGRVHDSLPLQLRRNGYKTVALYPSPRSFINTGHFYDSIGFDSLLDYYDLGASSESERDRFYYSKAIEQIRQHKASGSKDPLYIFVWTMASHGPYDAVLHPDVKPEPGAVCAKDASWAEYTRRLLMAEDDLAWFTERLKNEFPEEAFMLLGFGDHQPYISQEFLGKKPANSNVPSRDSIGYKTFFRITGVNFQPDWSAVPSDVDTPFLGNVMMQAARLPRFGFYNDRDKLMKLCDGRYNDCAARDEILSFHDRMIKGSAIVN